MYFDLYSIPIPHVLILQASSRARKATWLPAYTAFFKAKLESQLTVVKDLLDQLIQRTCFTGKI